MGSLSKSNRNCKPYYFIWVKWFASQVKYIALMLLFPSKKNMKLLIWIIWQLEFFNIWFYYWEGVPRTCSHSEGMPHVNKDSLDATFPKGSKIINIESTIH